MKDNLNGDKGRFFVSDFLYFSIENEKSQILTVSKIGILSFDTRAYLDKYLDVERAQVDPTVHFLKYGYFEGRFTNCLEHPRFTQSKSLRGVYELAELDSSAPFKQIVTAHTSDFLTNLEKVKSFNNRSEVNSTFESTVEVRSIDPLSRKPSVSFVIPCFKQVQFLPDCLVSIANSTVEPHECIIVDDGNYERSQLKLLESVLPSSPHQTVKIVTTRNRGLAGARNLGIGYSEAEFVKFIDADDLLIDGSIDLQLEALKRNKSDAVVSGFLSFGIGYGDATVIRDVMHGICADKQDRPGQLTSEIILRYWEDGLMIPIHSLLVRRDKVLKFDENLGSKEDFLFWLSLCSAGVSISNQREVVAIYRIHTNQMTRESISKDGYFMLLALKIAFQKLELDRGHILDKFKFAQNSYGKQALELFMENSEHDQKFIDLILERNT
jgi:glycosyltransferase involved in cell wall biosynthesis